MTDHPLFVACLSGRDASASAENNLGGYLHTARGSEAADLTEIGGGDVGAGEAGRIHPI
jgi:hypothetical protein